MVNKQHAYLIMAHNDFDLLSKLLELLDDEFSDIYLHIDKKAKGYDIDNIKSKCKRSTIYFTDRLDVTWGGDSQIKCEMLLIESAIKRKYEYYHLLSGVDLPLTKSEERNEFFKKNKGKEYIALDIKGKEEKNYYDRVMHYHYLRDKIGKNIGLKYNILRVFEKSIIFFQKIIGYDRMKKARKKYNIEYYKGDNWFSITDELANYIINNKKLIEELFYKTFRADEVFLQTIVMNSPYAKNVQNECLRYIDWEKGSPYTFKLEDYSDIMNSGKLFARKFSSNNDCEVIEKIYTTLKKEK